MKIDSGSVAVPMLISADIWNRDRLDKAHMDAYKSVEASGLIKINKVHYSKSERKVVIEYLSAAPIEWIREALKKAVAPTPVQVHQEEMKL